MIDLLQTQMELEEEALGLGIKRYRDRVQAAKEQGRESETMVGRTLLDRTLIKVTKAVEDWVEQSTQSRGNRNAIILKFIQQFDPDQVAFITSKSIINCISKKSRLQTLAFTISGLLEDEIEYRKFRTQDRNKWKYIQDKYQNTSSYRHKRYVTLRAKREWANIPDEKWTTRERLIVGTTLINIFIQATGLITIDSTSSKNRATVKVKPTEELMNWMSKQNARSEVMSPLYFPMVVPPRDWTTPYEGGYLFSSRANTKFIKVRNPNYIEELSNMDLSSVYSVVNALQATPWRINKAVLDVMKEVWDSGGTLGKLPSRDDIPLPAKPEDIATNDEARKVWKSEAHKVHAINARMTSKRFLINQKLWIAEKFVEFDKIYLPWSLDWRGRAYPIPNYVTPQADDTGKALLMFAEGKPLGETGAYWLAVHIANLFGYDKVSFDDRVAWVEENAELILDSALRPLEGERFWATADKPYCALAACFEWMGYTLQGNDYVSHLPIAMDGSCNGLQNFSAMLRDEVGGRAVNLIPQDKPNDIYMRVAEVVQLKIAQAVKEGNAFARAWDGRITRSLVKRPVMTLPYGSTQAGMREQLVDELDKAREEGKPILEIDESEEYPAVSYLAQLVYESIGEVVIAARTAMDWLQEVARIAAGAGLPIYWTTPMGLPIMQMYHTTTSKMVNAFISGNRYRLTLEEPTRQINKRKQGQGISPNVVHSLDAAHMQRTVLLCKQNGIDDFAMVHDSFGTHAANTEELYYLLRVAFIEQYSDNVLEKFRNEIINQLPPKIAEKIPELPPMGNLELERIIDSEYFFA